MGSLIEFVKIVIDNILKKGVLNCVIIVLV